MTYCYKKFEFTAFTEADFLGQGGNGDSIGCGDTFTMPGAATTCISTWDNDGTMSGDCRDNATDRSGQDAWIDGARKGGQLYAEQYHVLKGSDGKTYYMIEIEVEGYDAPGAGDDFFSFYGKVPPAGVELTVAGTCNVKGCWVDYRCLGAGEKEAGNEPPCFTNIPAHGVICVDENTTFVIDLDANDANGDTLSFEITGGADADLFEINAETGELTFKDAKDYETPVSANGDNTYDVSVKVADGNGGEKTVDMWVKVKDVPETGWIKGRLTNDADCNDNEWNAEKGCWDKGLDGQLVQLLDLNGSVVAEAHTNHDGWYMFDVPAGDYQVQFPLLDGYKFSAQNSGVDEHYDSDADATGLTEVITVEVCKTVDNVDAGLKAVATGAIAGTVFCDTNADGLSGELGTPGSSFSVVIAEEDFEGGASGWTDNQTGLSQAEGPGDFIIEAECMSEQGFHTVYGHHASGCRLIRLDCAGKTAEAWSDFGGETGTYDVTLFLQDECDGRSEITLMIGGQEVQAFRLDGDNNGWGSNHGHFSKFVIRDVDIAAGEEIRIVADGDHGEMVRFDKISFEGKAPVAAGNEYLGAHGHNHGLDTEKSFDLPEGTDVATITFDFLEIDSWDCEAFKIVVNGQWIELGRFSWRSDEGACEFDAGNGITIHKAAAVDISGYGAEHSHRAWNNDNAHAFTVTVENPGDTLTVGFDSHLNSGTHDERWGIDNLKIVASGEEAPTGPTLTEPVKDGVTIKLLNADGTPVLDANGDPITTVTDADGNYRFDNVELGEYKIMGVAPDGTEFTIQDVDGNAKDEIDSDVNADGLSGTITVTEDAVADVDLGLVDAAPKTGAIEGRLFDDANRNDVDDAEAGVPNVTVELIDATGAVVATAETGADGSYSFADVQEGDYTLRFPTEIGGKVLVPANDPNGNGSDANDSDADAATGEVAVTVIADQTADIDAGIADPATAVISGRVFDDANRNDVDDAEAGLNDVTVVLLNAAGDVVATTETETDGSYSFTGLTAGDYSVRFPTDVAGMTLVDANDPNGNGAGDDSDDSDADAATGETATITIGIGETASDVDAGVADPATGSVEGRIFCDENGNDVNDAEDGLNDVTIELLDASGAVVRTVETEADGSYSFAGLEAGAYTVRFPTDIDGKTLVDANDPNGNGSDANDSDADPQTGLAPITIGMGETATVDAGVADPATAAITGRVFEDANGDDVDANNGDEPGMRNVTVELIDLSQDPSLPIRTVETGDDGSYAFNDLPAGSYVVRFPTDIAGMTLVDANDPDGNGSEANDSDADQTSGETAPIDLSIGQTRGDVDAGVADMSSASISGRYFADEDRNGFDDAEPGVEDVTVQLLDESGEVVLTTTTDEEGEYSFTGLMAGTYSVLFFADPDGKTFIAADEPGDDENDSDAFDLDNGTAMTQPITVGLGQTVTNVDAGVEENVAPVATDDTVMACYDDGAVLVLDVLANDSDAEGFVDLVSISDEDEVADEIGESITLASGATATLNADGTVTFTSNGIADDLLSGQKIGSSFSYTITDEEGAEAGADVMVTLCGATDSLVKIGESLPVDEICLQLTDENAGVPSNESWSMLLSDTGDARLDALGEIATAYCVAIFDDVVAGAGDVAIEDAPVLKATISLATEANVAELDKITWILNQEGAFDTDGDGTADLFATDAEVQGAIWGLTDSFVFVPQPSGGSVANAEAILDLANAEGDGFVAGEGDIVALFINPTDAAQNTVAGEDGVLGTDDDVTHEQPFVIGVAFDALSEDCLC